MKVTNNTFTTAQYKALHDAQMAGVSFDVWLLPPGFRLPTTTKPLMDELGCALYRPRSITVPIRIEGNVVDEDWFMQKLNEYRAGIAKLVEEHGLENVRKIQEQQFKGTE